MPTRRREDAEAPSRGADARPARRQRTESHNLGASEANGATPHQQRAADQPPRTPQAARISASDLARADTVTSTTSSQFSYHTPVPKRDYVRDSLMPQAIERKRKREKGFSDRIYDSIRLPGLLVAVMDTPEFQRLHNVSQLGGSSYVYPSAKHSRKEHSIGVAHLAGELVTHLRETQPSLNITHADILCVQLAGLCHDIGHGPFSHMFEDFVKQAAAARFGRELTEEETEYYSHESRGCRLVKNICERQRDELKTYFDDDDEVRFDQHVEFACRLIQGLHDKAPFPEFDEIGRTSDKRFLFDIVNNKRSGVDVDKMDYLLRDATATLNRTKGYDWKRVVNAAQVKPFESATGAPMIAYEIKLGMDLNDMFNIRSRLHRQVYQHRVSNVAEEMIVDILKAADASEFRIRHPKQQPSVQQNGESVITSLRVSEAAMDDDAFVLLTDSILDSINSSTAAGLDKAHALLDRLARRDYYKLAATPRQFTSLPLCSMCGKPTEYLWRYCPECGASTARRKDPKKAQKCGDILGALTPSELWENKVYESAVQLQKDAYDRNHDDNNNAVPEARLLKREDVLVQVTSIKHGWPFDFSDPHGKRWTVRDPLRNIVVFNPKSVSEDGAFCKYLNPEEVSSLFLPRCTQECIVYCYYKGKNTDDHDFVGLAYNAVTGNAPPLEGRNNHPTPSPSRGPSSVVLVPTQDDDDDFFSGGGDAPAAAAAPDALPHLEDDTHEGLLAEDDDELRPPRLHDVTTGGEPGPDGSHIYTSL